MKLKWRTNENVKNLDFILFYFKFCRSYAPGKKRQGKNEKNMIYIKNRYFGIILLGQKKIMNCFSGYFFENRCRAGFYFYSGKNQMRELFFFKTLNDMF